MRDLEKTAQAGRKRLAKNDRRELTASDYIQLIRGSSLNGSDNLIELINKVYALGYEQGYRARKTEKKKTSKEEAIAI